MYWLRARHWREAEDTDRWVRVLRARQGKGGREAGPESVVMEVQGLRAEGDQLRQENPLLTAVLSRHGATWHESIHLSEPYSVRDSSANISLPSYQAAGSSRQVVPLHRLKEPGSDAVTTKIRCLLPPGRWPIGSIVKLPKARFLGNPAADSGSVGPVLSRSPRTLSLWPHIHKAVHCGPGGQPKPHTQPDQFGTGLRTP